LIRYLECVAQFVKAYFGTQQCKVKENIYTNYFNLYASMFVEKLIYISELQVMIKTVANISSFCLLANEQRTSTITWVKDCNKIQEQMLH